MDGRESLRDAEHEEADSISRCVGRLANTCTDYVGKCCLEPRRRSDRASADYGFNDFRLCSGAKKVSVAVISVVVE